MSKPEAAGQNEPVGATSAVSPRTALSAQQAAPAPRESEQLYRDILDNMIDGYYRTDVDGRLIMTSPSAARVVGYTPEELRGFRLAELYENPTDREAFLVQLQESDGEIHGFEAPLRHKDGHTIWLSTNARYLRDGEGSIIGVEGTSRDVSERRQLLRELAQNEQRIRSIVENVADGIVTIDESGAIEMANSAIETIFGYREEELIGRNVAMLMPEPNRSGHDGYIRRYLETGVGRMLGTGQRELLGQRKDGSTFPMELSVSAVVLGQRRIFTGAMRDISERKRAEEQLRQAHKMEAIGQLTGGIAHDFNNLLTVLQGNLGLLSEHTVGDEFAQSLTDTALKASERGAELTQRLLAFSRQQVLTPKVWDINALVVDAVEMARRTLGAEIQIETLLNDTLRNAEVDRQQFENAILNLAINARDAMPKGGKLSLETTNATFAQPVGNGENGISAGAYVKITVRDTGAGMTADVARRAFEPFFSTKDVGKGSGLGLSMVYGFARQSGGLAELQSVPGQGTTVALYLPAADGAVAGIPVDPPPRQQQSPGGGETLFVVEDDEGVRAFVTAALRGAGYQVIEAADGSAAMARLRDAPAIDLLISDVILPHGSNGREIAAAVTRRQPQARVLFMSGYAEDIIAHQGKLDKGVALLSKPFTPDVLLERVRAILDATQQQLAK